MTKLLQLHAEPAICSISLNQAVYCEDCKTISNSRPDRCGVCGSQAVLRIEPILNRNPEPPAKAQFAIESSQLRVVAA